MSVCKALIDDNAARYEFAQSIALEAQVLAPCPACGDLCRWPATQSKVGDAYRFANHRFSTDAEVRALFGEARAAMKERLDLVLHDREVCSCTLGLDD